MHTLRVFPGNRVLSVPAGKVLLEALQAAGLSPDAPCGGNGSCGKCRVLLDGREVLACRTVVDRDMTITLPEEKTLRILDRGIAADSDLDPVKAGYLLAFDIGTTSLVCYLLEETSGAELASAAMANPQAVFGADVISRIRAALEGKQEQLTAAVRDAMTQLIHRVCSDTGISPEAIGVVSVVGNPAMQQLFLGISPENLAAVPFAPALTRAEVVSCEACLPICSQAALLIVPNISGYIGADTLGCILATGLHRQEELTLLVDIGTNGEMVLGNRDRMVACSTAAGPALEGAGICCGMRGTDGAIDHVWLEKGEISYSVIGGGAAGGICGSGLIDAVAVALEMGWLNRRGRIQTCNRVLEIGPSVRLNQQDIRQLQLAKGAIHAGICLLARQLGVKIEEIRKVYLAGAFGSFLDPAGACRIGLLPEALLDKIEAVGNAAGSGAKLLARDKNCLLLTEKLTKEIEFLELASLAEFPKTFAASMYFREETL